MNKNTKETKVKPEQNKKDLIAASVIEYMFNNFYRRRARVYRVNFFRGIFFGLGSVVGGTLVVAFLVWLLGRFGDLPGGIGDFINNIIDSMQR